MADQRRDTRVIAAISTTTPIDATHQMTETSHRIPFGAEDIVVAMACSVLELAPTTNQHSRTETAAAPRRKASLPRRRV